MVLATLEFAPVEAVRFALKDSAFLKDIAAARLQTPQSRGLRQLSEAEIRILKSQNNAAEDWAQVWVAREFNPHKVVGCYLAGCVQLGVFEKKVSVEPGVQIGSGVYNSELINVSVGDNALVSGNSLIANYHIGDGAIVQGNGSVVCTEKTWFGNNQQPSLGLELGGRETGLYAEITVDVAAQVAGGRKNTEMLNEYREALTEYRRRAQSGTGVIAAHASVRNTSKVLNTYVGAYGVVDGAAWVENSTLLSSAEECVRVASGACVKDAIVQWGCRVETHGIVEKSVCCEHSFVDDHGKLVGSLLGPNGGISSGECVSSLLGPFVGFHHQSLLIAAYWPAGKGNIAYGANIGSNHTSKAADQELWPGEGMFFGLGVNIKFPADYSRAPYSIIAAGVTTPPQRVEMPFALINHRAEHIDGVSPAYNEILPGWVLCDNIYSVRRNERKYAIRDKASRNKIGFEIFRPEIVEMMVKARAALQKVDASLTPGRAALHRGGPLIDVARRPVYTDKDIPGLGKNFLKETARLQGIEAYTFYIRLYALKGLYFAVRFCAQKKGDFKRVLEADYISDPRYDHELALLLSEFPGREVPDLLRELVKASEKVSADTLLSKDKDDFRGVRIIPDYADVHVPASDDPFVKATRQEAAELKADVEAILNRM